MVRKKKSNLWKVGKRIVKRRAAKAKRSLASKVRKSSYRRGVKRLRGYGKQIPRGQRFKHPTA